MDEDIIEEEGEPIDPGDSSETSPVDEEPVPDVEDDGDRPDVDWGEDGVEGDADNQQTFTSQPVPPYRAGDLWVQSGSTKVCIVGKTAQQQFSADDWAPAEADEYVPTSTTRTVTLREVITDFSAESLAAYQASGAVAYALYDDGTRAQVAWSAVHEPQPTAPQVIANEALAIAEATNQHFWQRSSDPDQDGAGTGAFVTDEEQEAFLQAIAQDVQPTAQRPLHNLIMNAEGFLLRTAKRIRAAFAPSGVAFYDGNGNAASNIVASFGASGYQIGADGDAHIAGDYRSLQMVDLDGTAFFDIRDLRDQSGYATISESFIGDGATTTFELSYTVDTTGHSVTIDGSAVTGGWSVVDGDIVFAAAPAAGAAIVVTYQTPSGRAKAYTLGIRQSGSSIGAMSVAEGYGNTASGGRSHAEGYQTYATGAMSHAEGYNTAAQGSASHAEGYQAHADGDGSHAHGRGTRASSADQTALGRYNVEDAAGTYAEIVGNGTNGLARSNARTLDWSGNEWLAGDIDVGGTVRVGGADIYGLSSTSTASDIVSPSTGFTVNSANYAARGGVAMLSVSVKGFAASTGTQTVGTVASGKRPAIRAYGGFNNDRSAYCRVGTDGAIEVNWKTAPSATANYIFQFTYILA